MAYYPYQNQYFSQMAQYQPQNNQTGIIWIQGEQAAKSYLVAPNTTVLLMDSETTKFYLKSSDSSGMPLPLRVFEYKEITNNGSVKPPEPQTVDLSAFATKAEFEAFRDEINGLLKSVPKQTIKKEVKTDA